MASWIVAEGQVETLVQAIMEANRTGQMGDGKIFALPLDGMIDIRPGELESEAVQTAEKVLANP